MTKPEIIAFLKDIADHSGYDPEGSHRNAEKELLAFLDDPEITEAWNDAVEFWWYA